MDMKFLEAKTFVFWDVSDFPIPTGGSYLETIRSVLGNNGYTGELEITAYGEKKPDNLDAGITFELKRKKHSRLNKMLLDLALWQIDTGRELKPKNVLVLAENIKEETNFVYVSYNLAWPYNNCLWVLPADYEDEKIKFAKLPYASFLWKWQDLLAGKKPMSKEDECALRRKAPRFTWVCEEE